MPLLMNNGSVLSFYIVNKLLDLYKILLSILREKLNILKAKYILLVL
jgi:hypothetical protein